MTLAGLKVAWWASQGNFIHDIVLGKSIKKKNNVSERHTCICSTVCPSVHVERPRAARGPSFARGTTWTALGLMSRPESRFVSDRGVELVLNVIFVSAPRSARPFAWRGARAARGPRGRRSAS